MFRTILDWDLISKTQMILVYACVLEIGLYYLQVHYLYHPLANTELLLRFKWFLPILLLLNILIFLLGFILKPQKKWHYPYTLFAGVYYPLTLLSLPLAVGFLNLVNGVICIGIILISLILFPRRLVYICLSIYALAYWAMALLTMAGTLDYAMAFKPHSLIHPDIEQMYISASMFYSTIYTMITIVLFDVCIKGWKEKELRSERLSCTDELTGLLNRRGVNEMIDLQLQQARITGLETSLIVVDIDNFKKINDQYGHQQGDTVIQYVADLLRENLRTSDIVGRYGGEEFIIMLPVTQIDSAKRLAEMCRKSLECRPLTLTDGTVLSTQASFGISSTNSSGFDFDELFKQADEALYVAKNNGKNQVIGANI